MFVLERADIEVRAEGNGGGGWRGRRWRNEGWDGGNSWKAGAEAGRLWGVGVRRCNGKLVVDCGMANDISRCAIKQAS